MALDWHERLPPNRREYLHKKAAQVVTGQEGGGTASVVLGGDSKVPRRGRCRQKRFLSVRILDIGT